MNTKNISIILILSSYSTTSFTKPRLLGHVFHPFTSTHKSPLHSTETSRGCSLKKPFSHHSAVFRKPGNWEIVGFLWRVSPKNSRKCQKESPAKRKSLPTQVPVKKTIPSCWGNMVHFYFHFSDLDY